MAALLPSPPSRLAVAVSGGSDSMTLALLLRDWAAGTGATLLAFTVDHGLRAEAAEEARMVKDWLAARGIDTRILIWRGPHPASGVQEAAREARYDLLKNACRAEGISHLFLGHQLEDQLETFLMRLSKGSGLDGLAAMERLRRQDGLYLIRPLLGLPRDALRGYLAARGQPWIDDPSNDNPRYTRTRVSAVLAALTELPGSSRESVALALARLRRANEGLNQYVRQRIARDVVIGPFGTLYIPDTAFREGPEEIALRLLASALRAVSGGGHIRLASVEDLYDRLVRGGSGDGVSRRGATLGGAEIRRKGKGWHFSREAGRVPMPEREMRAGEADWIWDHRFIVRDPAPEAGRTEGLTLRALGTMGGRFALEAGLIPHDARLGARVMACLPGVWQGERLRAVPLPEGYGPAEGAANPRYRLIFRAFHWMGGDDLC